VSQPSKPLNHKEDVIGKALDRSAITLAVIGMRIAAYSVYGFLAQ
jgi:hypothetical protein